MLGPSGGTPGHETGVLRSAPMFQTFTETADPSKGAERAAALRAKLRELSLDGFIVPRADEHQGEYVPKSAERLAWLTGFSGSAGTAVLKYLPRSSGRSARAVAKSAT